MKEDEIAFLKIAIVFQNKNDIFSLKGALSGLRQFLAAESP